MDILSYLGGLFDGEGNASVFTVRRKFYPNAKKKQRCEHQVPCLQLKMTDEEPIRLLYDTFGGSFSKYQLPSKKTVYCWRVSHQKALTAAQKLLPFVKTKAGQLKKVIAYYQEAV